jgi:hypothetical protein
MYNIKVEKIPRMSVCVTIALCYSVLVMNMRCGGVKEKPDAGISLLFSKIAKGAARLNVPIWRTKGYLP